jgi:hypothetical protein
MKLQDLLDNWIGALIGGALFYFVPKIFTISISIIYVPAAYTNALGIVLRVLVGAAIGASLNMLYNKFKK